MEKLRIYGFYEWVQQNKLNKEKCCFDENVLCEPVVSSKNCVDCYSYYVYKRIPNCYKKLLNGDI